MRETPHMIALPITGRITWSDAMIGDLVCRLGGEDTALSREAITALHDLCQRLSELDAAARELLDGRFDIYKARNGREVSLQGDDGEKVWFVEDRLIAQLEHSFVKSRNSPGPSAAEPQAPLPSLEADHG